MTKQFRQITFLGIVLISLLNLAPAAAQELSGIIVSSDPDLSRALVIHDSAVSVRRIGASIADSDPRTIIEITRRYIVLDGPQGPQRWYLGGQSESSAAAGAAGAQRHMKSVSDSPRGSSESALSSPAENGEQASPAVLRFDRFVTVEWFARTGRGKGLKISDAVNTAWLDSSELRVNDVITQKGGVPAR